MVLLLVFLVLYVLWVIGPTWDVTKFSVIKKAKDYGKMNKKY